MPAHHGRAPRTPGPASGSLQGRNPRELRHRRWRLLYGDFGHARASTVVVSGSQPVTAHWWSGSWPVLGRSSWHGEGNREHFEAMIDHGDALPVGDRLCDPAFRPASSAIVMTYRS